MGKTNTRSETQQMKAKILEISKYPKKKLILHAHPFVSAYLKQGFRSYQRKWFSKHRKWVSIIERNNYPLMKYRFFDEQKNVLVQ